VLGPETAEIFAQLHRDHGVDLRTGVQLTEITGSARADGMRLGDGSQVDAGLRTDGPDIYAAGDVASAFRPRLGRHLRVEHWANALNQPQAAARSMLGQAVAYDRVPYFYSDQYELGME
jgi:3-phenylpropionate/trans-cinnamate dioxygenase ferredoxin reductase component